MLLHGTYKWLLLLTFGIMKQLYPWVITVTNDSILASVMRLMVKCHQFICCQCYPYRNHKVVTRLSQGCDNLVSLSQPCDNLVLWLSTGGNKYTTWLQPCLVIVTRCSGQLRTGNFFAPCMLLIKTVMRLFTAASNYSQLWLCSFDYDSHE